MNIKEAKEKLIIKYANIINEYENQYTFTYDFGREFNHVDGCYDVHRILLANNVVTKKTRCDHEYSCCYYYFSTYESSMKFVYRLVDFLIKRNEIAEKYGFEPANLLADKKSRWS